ncbi:hypothetical protein HYPSUDRAFT_32522 [Hypholoma sublateritium FD-334 SS-4]|uniref:Uncharacterized protein n=1 Tax=Hypholoma sublateritium (strain FD-334 SS-4) TaxID=945553 RepID=A0A0D2PLC4_HYPSF|nr:hypothetical protein HYPSUDRAFT_32522 [Hypholoma sublateritium FD-334 SS-4]
MKSSKPRDYCCCAIPLVNAGIYATLIEQTAAGLLIGTLSIATPEIVGASTFSAAKWILAILAYVVAGVQLLGFIGVSREKPSLYRRYVTLHGLCAPIAFSVAAAWIIMSATRHSTAKAQCILNFFADDNGASTSEGDTLCNIFPWVDVGIMGGLWVVLAALHIYLYVVISSYANSQRRDHDRYNQVYDPSQPITENVPLNEQNDPWDSRPSGDYLGGRKNSNYNHVRQESSMSASDVYNQPYQEPKDAFSTSNLNYDYANYDSQNPQNPAYPSYAHTQNALPTPTNNYNTVPADSRIEHPLQAHPHPAEGSFGRKTPRIA